MVFSIITVNLNNREGLYKTIKSVVSQTFHDYEFIIIDGGSIDGSKELIQSFNVNIDLWISEKDTGIYNAMNKGINKSSGKYLLFLNSGDFFVDEYVLERISSQKLDADMLLGDCNISEKGKIIHIARPSSNLSLSDFYDKTIPHQSTFIKRCLFEEFGLYSEEYKIHGDLEFWIRTIFFHNCTLQRLNIVVADYNIEGLSSDITKTKFFEEERQKIFDKYFSKRVMTDYNLFEEYKAKNEIYEWIENRIIIKKFNIFLYKTATKYVIIRKSVLKLLKLIINLYYLLLFGIKRIIIITLSYLKYYYYYYFLKPIFIFSYHQISDEFIPGLHNDAIWTSKKDFEESLLFLKRNNFRIVSLENAIETLKSNTKRKQRFAVLTIDDGYATCLQLMELLDRLNVPVTFFYNTAYLGDAQYSWIDIANVYHTDLFNFQNKSLETFINDLHYTNNPATYEHAKKVVESISFNRTLTNIYCTKEDIIKHNNVLFTIGMHGHEHANHKLMNDVWCQENIIKNYDILKVYPNFKPYFAFPFGQWDERNLEFVIENNLVPIGCDGKLNYKYELPLHRIALDNKRLTNRQLRRSSGISFSFKNFLKSTSK